MQQLEPFSKASKTADPYEGRIPRGPTPPTNTGNVMTKFIHRIAALGLSAAIVTVTASAAMAAGVRDCRADNDIVLPVVPSGFDTIVAHATDDLTGPSIFERFAKTEGDEKIDIELKSFDGYEAQIDAYLACETPFMRVTHGMLSQISDQVQDDPRTKAQPIFNFGWSNGGKALVARNASKVADLAGETILAQVEDIDFALQMASEANPSAKVEIVDDASAAFASGDAGFAVVNSTDAKILTAGNVGTGAEGSVKGAQTMLTTTSASRVISDMLIVRSDYADANPQAVRGLVRALLKAEELFREDAKKQIVDFELAAGIVLGDEGLDDKLQDMWRGVETVGLNGQADWATDTHPRSFRSQVNTGQNRMVAAGMLDQAVALASPAIDYASLGDDIWDKRRTTTSGFNQDAATAAIESMSNEDLSGKTIASVTINFEPKQFTFPVEQYQEAFEQALEKSMLYGGAVLSVEGHAAYLSYVRGVVKDDWTLPKQKLEMQALDRVSTRRAMAVRSALVETAAQMNLPIDESQITINGRGIEDPLGGFCKQGLPCPPQTEDEWKKSRRVVFRVIEMESEAEVFTPLNDW